jgi:hypothetical protein
LFLPQPHVPASSCRGGWEPSLLLPSQQMYYGRDLMRTQDPLCQLSECPTSLLNLMLNHRDCPQCILMRIHRNRIILISLQNLLNDVQSRVVGAVDGFHGLVGTDVSMTGHQRESSDLMPLMQLAQAYNLLQVPQHVEYIHQCAKDNNPWEFLFVSNHKWMQQYHLRI